MRYSNFLEEIAPLPPKQVCAWSVSFRSTLSLSRSPWVIHPKALAAALGISLAAFVARLRPISNIGVHG